MGAGCSGQIVASALLALQDAENGCSLTPPLLAHQLRLKGVQAESATLVSVSPSIVSPAYSHMPPLHVVCVGVSDVFVF